ncbi:MAG: hypothetical protein ACPL1H_08870 [bacterium]
MKRCFVIVVLILAINMHAKADTTQKQIINLPSYAQTQPKTHTFSSISITGQNGSINVPSAFIKQYVGGVAIYNAYTYQSNMLTNGDSLNNDTVYGAFSFAPLKYLELSISTSNSTSRINSQQTLKYYGDLRFGIKAGYSIMPQLGIAVLGEILTYSKAGNSDYAGYNADATGYTLSFLASYDMLDSSLSFPMIANLRVGYLWDNTQKLITSNENNFIPPIGKYAMGIRGDNLTLLGVSLLFPFPAYYIEPMLEFTSQFANTYSSYASTDTMFTHVSFNQNPVYLTPGIIFYTPVDGLRIAVGVQLSTSRKLNLSTGPAYSSPQTVWVTGISYSISRKMQ